MFATACPRLHLHLTIPEQDSTSHIASVGWSGSHGTIGGSVFDAGGNRGGDADSDRKADLTPLRTMSSDWIHKAVEATAVMVNCDRSK